MSGSRDVRDLVLVGGGHAHVQVLRALAETPAPATRLTLVSDRATAVYSGMVPGLIAGQYQLHELEIDLARLAERADARFVEVRASRVDPAGRRVEHERGSLPYDVLSIDVGSTVAGLDLPGVREHALATRPIGKFVLEVPALAERVGAEPRVCVVGAGAAGVEVAFALRACLGGARVSLLDAASDILPGYSAAAVRRVRRAARARNIELRLAAQVRAVETGELVLEDGARLGFDLLVWVAGASGLPLARRSGLPTDAAGFVRVDDTFAVQGHDAIFAVGDCASLAGYPSLPKAGVYAVRSGPVLIRNLRAQLAGQELEAYRPQQSFLSLLNLGDGRALACKWSWAVEGRWVMRWKDWIDRRFVEGFA